MVVLVVQPVSVSSQCAAQQIVGGELLIVAFIQNSLGHNRSGN
jgi:hypothetical protein